MLRVGQLPMSVCGGIARREFLQVGAAGALGLTLSDVLRGQARASSTGPARSVILLWLWGGPSHLDLWDPKPNASVEYRGPYAPIPTRVPGIQITELMPKLAKRVDQFAILRSLHHESNDHGIAGTIGLTGASTGAISLGGQVIAGRLLPHQGSVITRVRREIPGGASATDIPAFVAIGGPLHQGKRRIAGEGAAALGGAFDPFRIECDAQLKVQIPQMDVPQDVPRERMLGRRDLLTSLDAFQRTLEHDRSVDDLDRFQRRALEMVTSPAARAAFDLEREPIEIRRAYGKYRFGQGCLLARRLVEAGVRFVQVNWSSHVEAHEDTGDGGWDMHDRNFQILQDRHSWMLDQALCALVDDLDSRRLLAETCVLAVGEFGRTPKINGKSGRDHWNQCYSGLVAGGGFRGGQVVGASDKRGEYPAILPVTPADLSATLFRCLGIGSAELTQAGVSPQGTLIEDLL